MKMRPLRRPGTVAGAEIFRVASLGFYITLLLHAALGEYVEYVRLADLGIIAASLLSLLFIVALSRYLWPNAVAYGRGRLTLELWLAIFAVLGLSLEQTTPVIAPMPWLIGLASIFPLALERPLALLVTLSLSLIGIALNITLGLRWVDWLPHIFATTFAGLSATFLADTLRNNLAAIRRARMNKRRFNALARAAQQAFVIVDATYKIQYANQSLRDVIGYSAEEVLAQDLRPTVHPDDKEEHQRKLRYLRDTPHSTILSSYRIRHKDGRWVWLETRGYNMLHDRVIEGLVFSVEDVSARKETELELQQEHALLRAVLDVNPSMIYAIDTEGRFTISNLSFQRRFGYASEDDLRGKTMHDVFLNQAPSGQQGLMYTMANRLHQQDMQVIQSGQPLEDQEMQGLWDSERRAWHRVNKFPLRDYAGNITGMLCIARDITDRKEYEMQLQHQALHDPLTGLPNRRYLLKTIADTIAQTDEASKQLAMLFCDLDFFKSVNDIHGHDFGDKCLMEITRRIQAKLPRKDFVARFGGNEFAVLSNASVEEAKAKAHELLETVSQQLVVDDAVVKIQASIGIAVLDPEHKTPSELVRAADAAMFQAKERGRNRAEVFDASMQSNTTKRAQMDVALRFALERAELTPVYQPKVSILNGTVKGFELLLRWNNPQYGAIPPVEFIPVAENSGLVVPIGLWVLEQACMQLRHWREAYPEAHDFTVAVNVSMRQLLQPNFLADVTTILERTGTPPNAIELELTETSAMANPVQTIETLTRLKHLGLRLALDDFGTGYSSLAYLQKLPIDMLKIDKAFVQGLGKNPGDAEIVRLILALAQTLNLETVAEGVETRNEMNYLKKMGCYVAQGFAFSPAVTPDVASDMIRNAHHFSIA